MGIFDIFKTPIEVELEKHTVDISEQYLLDNYRGLYSGFGDLFCYVVSHPFYWIYVDDKGNRCKRTNADKILYYREVPRFLNGMVESSIQYINLDLNCDNHVRIKEIESFIERSIAHSKKYIKNMKHF